jgi:hypothetical protein
MVADGMVNAAAAVLRAAFIHDKVIVLNSLELTLSVTCALEQPTGTPFAAAAAVPILRPLLLLLLLPTLSVTCALKKLTGMPATAAAAASAAHLECHVYPGGPPPHLQLLLLLLFRFCAACCCYFHSAPDCCRCCCPP